MKNKGKCFSKINQGKRLKGDTYQTPYLMTQSLFDNEVFDDKTSMLEPACGEKAIVKIIKKNYFGKLKYYDIKEGRDFLEEKEKYTYIITNPPFNKANQFILKAKEITTIKFCFLMPLGYLQGQWRFENIFNVISLFQLTKIYVFTRMPMLSNNIREDGKYETGMQSYGWFIWERSSIERINHPIIYWIDSKNHIVRK